MVGTACTVTNWASSIPEDEWSVYRQAINALDAQGIPFALGGAFALASYTGFWRDTKDLDLYVLPRYKDAAIDLLNGVGMADFYDRAPYDRWWIYRSVRNDTIVDVIWAMANHRTQIDDLWMSGPEVQLRTARVRVLPAEALLWDKLYIMQRDRCDWPDVFNLLYAAGTQMDWEYMLHRMEADCALLAGALPVYRWFAPGSARKLPGWIWDRLGLGPMEAPQPQEPEYDPSRVALLDTRPWFGPDRERRLRS